MTSDQQQLGFEALLFASDADSARTCRADMEEALPFYRALIEQHHAEMLAGDSVAVQRIRDEADALALKLNNYEPGILADEDAPGCILAGETRADDGAIPLWGQEGSFIVTRGAMQVRIELEGMFGIGSSIMAWPGFSAHAVDWGKPFLSETGYRSFLGLGGALEPGHTPESFCAAIIEAHVTRELKGKLRMIAPQYRRRSSA